MGGTELETQTSDLPHPLAEPVIGPATSGRTRWLATSPQRGEVMQYPSSNKILLILSQRALLKFLSLAARLTARARLPTVLRLGFRAATSNREDVDEKMGRVPCCPMACGRRLSSERGHCRRQRQDRRADAAHRQCRRGRASLKGGDRGCRRHCQRRPSRTRQHSARRHRRSAASQRRQA